MAQPTDIPLIQFVGAVVELVLYGSSARLGPGGARLTPFPAHRRVCRALRRHRLGPADVAAGRAGACEPVHRHLLVVRVLHAHCGASFCCPCRTLRADCVALALRGHHLVHLLRICHSGEGSGGPAGVLGRHGLERSPPPRGDVRALRPRHRDDAGGDTPCAVHGRTRANKRARYTGSISCGRARAASSSCHVHWLRSTLSAS
jgi:hypothetical protein